MREMVDVRKMLEERAPIVAKAAWREREETPKPDVSFVPPMERRRLTQLEKAALSVAWRTAGGKIDCPVVFASRWGEIGTTLKLIRQMHDEGEMSPAGFSKSGHNAAPGHLSVLAKNTAPYTAIAAGPQTYEMGLLEALSRGPGRVLFVYAEETTPSLYRPHFPDVRSASAQALLLDVAE